MIAIKVISVVLICLVVLYFVAIYIPTQAELRKEAKACIKYYNDIKARIMLFDNTITAIPQIDSLKYVWYNENNKRIVDEILNKNAPDELNTITFDNPGHGVKWTSGGISVYKSFDQDKNLCYTTIHEYFDESGRIIVLKIYK